MLYPFSRTLIIFFSRKLQHSRVESSVFKRQHMRSFLLLPEFILHEMVLKSSGNAFSTGLYMFIVGI